MANFNADGLFELPIERRNRQLTSTVEELREELKKERMVSAYYQQCMWAYAALALGCLVAVTMAAVRGNVKW